MAGTLTIDTLQSSTTGPAVFKNSSGIETGQLCRAWVNFNGVTTATIRASFNISSVTKGSGGSYVVNFTNAMPDANYCATTAGRVTSTTDGRELVSLGGSSQINPSTTQFAIQTCINNIGNDIEYIYVAIFR